MATLTPSNTAIHPTPRPPLARRVAFWGQVRGSVLGQFWSQVLQSNKCGGKHLGRREDVAEFGGDLFEAFLALHPGDALHAATPIPLIPGDDVDVGMKDLLPGRIAIIDAQIKACRAHGHLHFCRHQDRRLKKPSRLFGWHFGKRGVMLPRNDQRVPWGAREDVEEGYRPFPFKNLMGGPLSVSNLAKKASAHCTRRPLPSLTGRGTRSTT